MTHIKSFKAASESYRKVQEVNGGVQWRCDYADGESALVMIYKSSPTRADIIDSFLALNFN